jgi:hypothetical protein
MKRIPGTAAMLLLSLMSGCGLLSSAPRGQGGWQRLGAVSIAMPAGDGRMAITDTRATGATLTGAVSAVDLTRRAADAFRYELQRIGVHVVADTSGAATVAEFALGDVRFDSSLGWIASSGIVRIRRVGSTATVSQYSFQARNSSQPVRDIVDGLIRSIDRQ